MPFRSTTRTGPDGYAVAERTYRYSTTQGVVELALVDLRASSASAVDGVLDQGLAPVNGVSPLPTGISLAALAAAPADAPAIGQHPQRFVLSGGTASQPVMGEKLVWQQGPVLAELVTLRLDSDGTRRAGELQQEKLVQIFGGG